MKKLFAGIITCATILLTGIGVSAAAADENNSGDENVQSEIVFCTVNSERTGKTSYSYGGFFIQNNGNVRHFYFEDIEDNWMLIFGSGSYNEDGNIELNAAMPHDKLLSRLNDNISEYKIVGNISEEEYNSQISLLSEIKVDAKIPFVPFQIVQTVGMTSYTESFGVRYDDDDNAQIVFMNGHVSGDMKYRTYLENPDEKSIELNNWLIEKCKSFMSSEPITTTAPTTPDATTTTTVTTTEVTPSTEPSKNENEQSEIAFCVVNSEQTGKMSYSYGGFFIENNGNVRHFYFEDIEDNWMLIFGSGSYNEDGNIELNAAMPHDKLLSRLNDNISEYKIVGNISEEEYASKASLLSEINLNAEIPFAPFQTAGMTSYTESFGVRYDNDDNAQIVFMNGHVSGDMKYRPYLENPDEKSIELNNWLIEKCKSFMSSEPITTTAPTTTPDATTTTTVTTTITAETNTEQTTEPPATDAGGSVTTETSTVPPTTTTGTETTLPQTGYSKWYQALIAAAMGMIGVGSTAIVKSGIFRKKENNS